MKNQNQPSSMIAKTLGISESAVNKNYWKILRAKEDGRDIETLIATKGRPKIATTEIDGKLSEIVQNDNSLTQNGMIEKLALENINTSQSSVSKSLKRLNIKRKRLKLKPEVIIQPNHIESRKAYARIVRPIPDSKLLFLDESGFNLHTTLNYGYSPVGIEAIRMVPANRQRNVSLMAVIGSNGILHHKMIKGSYNAEIFRSFLDEMKVQLQLCYPEATIVMDNARFHHSQIITQWFSENDVKLQFLPTYSPELNPIENFFGALKARYGSISGQPRSAEDIIERVTKVISDMNAEIDFTGFYRRMRVYLDKAFSGLSFY